MIETVFILGQIVVIMAFLVIVAYSKHLHIALAPINVGDQAAAARPWARCGRWSPAASRSNFEEADPEEDQFGGGKVEEFTWKGLLDFTTCTECGRCQSQCPAWNTGKPLSPKLLVTEPARPRVRQGAVPARPAAARTSTRRARRRTAEPAGPRRRAPALAEAERPLIGGADDGGVIDPDVLWSCTTCGACVEQCPVDIEHVDHIVDMRRYQVLIESNFPAEAGVMLRNLENKGNPWGAPPNTREDWTKGLDFEVPRVGEVGDFEYLFWVGCAGAFEDRAKKTTRAVATLLHEAGRQLRDPRRRRDLHRRPGPPDRQRVRLPDAGPAERRDAERGVRRPARSSEDRRHLPALLQHPGQRVRAARRRRTRWCTTPSCWPTWSATGKLTPVQPIDGGVTYHDPCYLGRHNRVFAPPREVLGAVSADGAGRATASPRWPRNAERSFCCGAGGARMWMEERIGKRINVERVEEALGHRGEDDRGRLPVLPRRCSATASPQKRRRRGRGRRGRRRRHRAAPRASSPAPLGG